MGTKHEYIYSILAITRGIYNYNSTSNCIYKSLLADVINSFYPPRVIATDASGGYLGSIYMVTVNVLVTTQIHIA